jgi:hypothetical protein
MTTQTKIIIGVVVASAVIGGAYYFYKKNKAKADKPSIDTNTKEECSKSGGNWDEATKTCKPKLVLTAEQIKVLQGLPNFAKF